jgi:hypothetical protein
MSPCTRWSAPPTWVSHIREEVIMIVAIVTFQLPKATTAEEMSAPFEAAVPMFQSAAGLLTKYFYVSEDGHRAGGVYVWASRADADRLYSGEWRSFVEKKFGSPPTIDFLNSPVMVDNRAAKSA